MRTAGEIDLRGLRARLSDSDALVTDLTGRDDYLHDATEHSNVPVALVFASTREDVVVTVDFCREQRLPLTVRGAGTGLSGGAVAAEGALLLSTEKLQKLEIDPDRRKAVCGPGVITKTVVDAAAPHGLTYAPDPASYDESTIGGNVAENAGGLRCLKYGVTRDYVLGLEVVTMDGGILNTGVLNGHRGFSLGDVLIGSEGTLGVLTEVTLRLIETPGRGNTILVAFRRPRDAAQTVADIRLSGLVPAVMEFLDGDAAQCSNDYERTEGLDNVAAILLIETGGEDAKSETTKIRELCERNQATYLRHESDAQRAESLWKVRRNLSKAIKAAARVRISEDVAVPNSQFPVLVDWVAEQNRRSSIRMNSFGHAGDGNLHVNFLGQTGSDDEMSEIQDGIDRLMRKTLELGGTLTGEHGIGLAKRRYLPWEFDAATLGVMRKIKSVLDPDYLLNPDKLFPDKN